MGVSKDKGRYPLVAEHPHDKRRIDTFAKVSIFYAIIKVLYYVDIDTSLSVMSSGKTA